MMKFPHLIRHRGIEPLFRAIEISVTAQCNGHPFHIHTEGLRGTGKTSVIRAAQKALPPITRIRGCIYNCDPAKPHCPNHRHLSRSQVSAIGSEVVPRPFLEISHSAKAGSVVGSIDLGKLTSQEVPLAALLPGTIPQAHRGIIFIDEINRLADTSPELADILLDVMGTKPGRIQIEEPGLPVVEMPVSVSVWAASNPDEDPGPLHQIRKQLADRFDFLVPVSQPQDTQSVFDILKHRAMRSSAHDPITPLSVANMDTVHIPDDIRRALATIYVAFKLESLRAVETIETAAVLDALLSGSNAISLDHLSRVLPYALGHRTSAETLAAILKYLEDLKTGNLGSASAAAAAPSSLLNYRKGPNRFKSWLYSLLSRLPFRDRLPQSPSSNSPEAKKQDTSPVKLPNSRDSVIAAPPKPASPLSELADEQLITASPKHHE